MNVRRREFVKSTKRDRIYERTYCAAPGCERRTHGGGCCLMHYKRLRRGGTLDVTKAPNGEPLCMRISRNVVVDDGGCWIWQGAVNASGYGILCQGGKTWLAHRWVFDLMDATPNHELHHLCREKLCVCPWHLLPLTRNEHLRLHGKAAA